MRENKILKEQVEDYEKVIKIANEVDSLRIEQINTLSDDYIQQINILNKNLQRKDKNLKYWKIGGITVSIGLLLFILLK